MTKMMLIMAAKKILEETGYDYTDNLASLNARLNTKSIEQLIYELRIVTRFNLEEIEPYSSLVGC